MKRVRQRGLSCPFLFVDFASRQTRTSRVCHSSTVKQRMTFPLQSKDFNEPSMTCFQPMSYGQRLPILIDEHHGFINDQPDLSSSNRRRRALRSATGLEVLLRVNS